MVISLPFRWEHPIDPAAQQDVTGRPVMRVTPRALRSAG